MSSVAMSFRDRQREQHASIPALLAEREEALAAVREAERLVKSGERTHQAVKVANDRYTDLMQRLSSARKAIDDLVTQCPDKDMQREAKRLRQERTEAGRAVQEAGRVLTEEQETLLEIDAEIEESGESWKSKDPDAYAEIMNRRATVAELVEDAERLLQRRVEEERRVSEALTNLEERMAAI